MDEVCQSETIRRVLKVESMLEGGCRELLDKEQTLIKQGPYVYAVTCSDMQ